MLFLSRVSLVILALKRASISQMQFNQEKKFIQLLKRYVRDETQSAFVKEVLLARHNVVLFSHILLILSRKVVIRLSNRAMEISTSNHQVQIRVESRNLFGCGNVPQKQTLKSFSMEFSNWQIQFTKLTHALYNYIGFLHNCYMQ